MASLTIKLPAAALLLLEWVLLLTPPAQVEGWGSTFSKEDYFGVIKSPNYPGYYRNGMTVVWTIPAKEDYLIRLIFRHPYEFEGCADFLNVHDGSDVTKFCGTSIPPDYTSKTPSLRLEFRSDGSVLKRGFHADWIRIPSNNVLMASCRNSSTGLRGVVATPGFPRLYSGDRYCTCFTWNISAPLGKFIRLEFTLTFDLGSNGNDTVTSRDKIEVFDIFSNRSLISRGEWYGADTPPVLKSFGSDIMIAFHSDNNNNKKNGLGFQATWEAVSDCGGTYTSDKGQIMSYDYINSNSRPANPNCTWDIVSPDTYHIVLNVHYFGDECENFEILDFSEDGDRLPPYDNTCCDNVTTGGCIIRSSGPRMRVIYHKTENASPGFFATWQRGCGQMLDSSTGNFTSPSYGLQQYPINQDCEWTITATEDHVVRLDFQSSFDIETSNTETCSYDYVEAFDVLPNEDTISMGRFCGSHAPPQLISSSNQMVVRFHSDQAKGGTGFVASWDTACGYVMNSPEGTVISPRFPQPYPPNMACRWEIHVEEGHVITLAFPQPLALEGNPDCDADFVEVYDYTENGTTVMKGRWCGQETPPLLSSVTSRMLIVFQSDDAKSGTGFQAHWTSGKICGEVFHSPNGSFTSPGHPDNYPNNMDCRWKIHVNPGNTIRLEFGPTFDLEMDSDDCAYDYVEVFDAFSNGTLISNGKWCSVRKIPVFYSLSSMMLVSFHSDREKNGKGFSATWDSIESGCGGRLTTKTGHLMSPNYPSNYAEYTECRWVIQPTRDAGNENVTLHFDPSFDVEPGQDCAWDYVEIHRGPKLLGRWCGNDIPSDVISGGQPLVVVFQSDKSYTRKGFFASWR